MARGLAVFVLAFVPALVAPVLAAPASAQATQTGASGLPLPRFVSIRPARVNVRIGPSLSHAVAWTFVRAGVPVEVTQEYDIWYRIRDSEGQEGWLQKSMVSGARTAFVTPWESAGTVPMRDKANGAVTRAYLEPRALVTVSACDGTWCQVGVQGYRGFVEQNKLWGVYPNERVD